MSGPTQEELSIVLDKIVEGATYDVAMAAVGRTRGKTFFSWVAKSKRDERLRRLDSVYFLKWSGDEDGDDSDEQPDWLHVHWQSAVRARRSMIYESILVSQAMHGVEEIIRDGSTGRIVWELDERFVGLSDAEIEIMFGIPAAEVEFYRIKRDENKMPIPAVRVTQLPATLRQAILRGLIPGVYGDHQTVDVQQTNRVFVQHSYLRRPTTAPLALPAPSPDAPAPAPAPVPERVDSDVVREMKERIRASFKPPANPRPDPRLRPVEIYGRATGDKPDNVSAFPTDVPPRPDYPGASEAPAPKPARAPAPNYGRVSQIDKPGIGSRSNPPPGGFRIR